MTNQLDTPEYKVGSAVHALHTIISDLWRLRLSNETADEILKDQDGITVALRTLSDLHEDIRYANDKLKVAAE